MLLLRSWVESVHAALAVANLSVVLTEIVVGHFLVAWR
jgi:hypothetical protein